MTTVERKLPITYPFITTFPQQTNVIAMISMHQEALPWIHSNLIQLKCSHKPHALDLLIYPDNVQRFCPLVEYQCLTRRSLGQWFPSVIDFVLQCLDDGLYFHATVNSYYISAYNAYFAKLHRFHELFIFGYNRSDAVFYAADFFNDGKYEFMAVSFAEFERAYVSVDETNNGHVDYVKLASTDLNNHLNVVETLRFHPRSHLHSKTPYRLDIGNIADLLGDYVTSSNTSRKYTVFENASTDHFGMKVYEMLERNIEAVSAGELDAFDSRSFHILAEHKKCMLLRVQYMCEMNVSERLERYLDGLKSIQDQAVKLKYQAIKYFVSPSPRLVAGLREGLQELVRQEKEVLSRLHEDLLKLTKQM